MGRAATDALPSIVEPANRVVGWQLRSSFSRVLERWWRNLIGERPVRLWERGGV